MSEINNVSSVSSNASSVASYSKAAEQAGSASNAETAKQAVESPIDGVSAVYEASDASKKEAEDATKATYSKTQIADAIKEANNARIQQLQDIVNKLLTKQGATWDAAQGLKQMYENLEVDEETRAQAQKDIAEDGYWGVEQTSDRILDFAEALSGGDPEKMEEMREAFKKGYKQATKAWGDELPQISKDTYDAVMKKFDDYAASKKAAEAQA